MLNGPEMALSLALLIGAALLFRSMRNAYQADTGFERKNLCCSQQTWIFAGSRLARAGCFTGGL
jgi:hypothetical protein